MVDFSGVFKEGGIKAQRKHKNFSKIWAPQPTYDGKIFTCRSSDGRDYTVSLEREID